MEITGSEVRAVGWMIKHLPAEFHPYKLQIVQELKPNDSVLCLQFCENLLAKIKEDANCEMDST
jgi:hypothetical protein